MRSPLGPAPTACRLLRLDSIEGGGSMFRLEQTHPIFLYKNVYEWLACADRKIFKLLLSGFARKIIPFKFEDSLQLYQSIPIYIRYFLHK